MAYWFSWPRSGWNPPSVEKREQPSKTWEVVVWMWFYLSVTKGNQKKGPGFYGVLLSWSPNLNYPSRCGHEHFAERALLATRGVRNVDGLQRSLFAKGLS